MNTDAPLDLGTVYREARLRVATLVTGLGEASLPDATAIPVPACPAWTVHDVVAHLVAVVEDVMGGRLTGIPTEEDTAAQVARRAGQPVAEMIEEWNELSAAFEALLSTTPIWPAAMDVLSHEQDIRGATDQPGARDVPAIVAGARRLTPGIPAPVALVVHLDDDDHRMGPEAGDGPALELTTTTFEAFRFRLGRRSRAQLAAMAWNGDPEPVLDHLTIFGPSSHDIIE